MKTKEFYWVQYVELWEVKEKIKKLNKKIQEVKKELNHQEILRDIEEEGYEELEALYKEQKRELKFYKWEL